MRRTFYLLATLFMALQATAQPLPRVTPEQVGMDTQRLKYADQAIQKAVDNKEIPGAVLAVVKDGKMAYLKAYGNKQVYPKVIAMDTNTVFDMASVSKSMSTAICAMMLIERGQLRLQDKVSLYVPGFKPWQDSDGKKTDIRVADLDRKSVV